MKRMATLTGHTYRVLYLAASPDGQTLVTGAGDETLRFWKVFPPKINAKEDVPSKQNNKSFGNAPVIQPKKTESLLTPSMSDMR